MTAFDTALATTLPTNIDSTYPDIPTDPSAKAHQQQHDIIGIVHNGLKAYLDGLTFPSSVTYAMLPAGSTVTIDKVGGVWPGGTSSTGVRPSARADLVFRWRGQDPSPAIVSSGTGGMLDNVDERIVLP